MVSRGHRRKTYRQSRVLQQRGSRQPSSAMGTYLYVPNKWHIVLVGHGQVGCEDLNTRVSPPKPPLAQGTQVWWFCRALASEPYLRRSVAGGMLPFCFSPAVGTNGSRLLIICRDAGLAL